jgi:class 3 adenylate cyclase
MGIRERLTRPPAMCFLDLTGYTRLTEEHGDEAAADLAASLASWFSASRSITGACR